MKRYFSLLLIVLLIPALLAVPARADEVTESGWIQLLDYGYASGYNSNYISLVSDGMEKSMYLQYSNPGDLFMYDFDIIFRTDDSSPRIETTDTWLDIVALGDGLYRAFGSQTSNISTGFTFYYNDATFLEILSFKVSTVSSVYRTLSANMSGLMWDGTEFSASYTGSGYVAADWSGGNATPDYRRFSTYLYVNGNLQAYDYVDINLTLSVSEIQSIAVDDGMNPLPYEISSIYQPTSTVGTAPNTVITLRIDIRGLEDGYKPFVRITGYSSTGVNRYTISYVGGIVVIDPPSPLTYWFTNTILAINEGFSSMGASITAQTETLATWIYNQTGSLTSALESSTTTISNWIYEQTSKINEFSANVGIWISNQTSAIGGWFTQQTTVIETWGQSLKDSIDALPKKIAEELQGLFVPSESAVQNMGQQSEELAQDRFGGVYEGAQIVDNFASQLKPEAATQILTVPVVELNILGSVFPLGGWDVDLVPEGTEIIVETCKIVIDIIATLAFINGLKSRLERTLEQ